MTLKFARWLRKWVWCSWRHYYHRCYPTVWGPEQAAEIDQPYTPNYWHCARCHPCNEWVEQRTNESMNTQDYRDALGGEGPQAGQWADKPHRLVYDLCNEVERLQGGDPPVLTAEEVWSTGVDLLWDALGNRPVPGKDVFTLVVEEMARLRAATGQ